MLPSDKPIKWEKTIKVLGIYFLADLEHMRSMNYEPLLEKIKSLTDVWSL